MQEIGGNAVGPRKCAVSTHASGQRQHQQWQGPREGLRDQPRKSNDIEEGAGDYFYHGIPSEISFEVFGSVATFLGVVGEVVGGLIGRGRGVGEE